ncbi:hypothetical protein [Streptomyces gilvifuscus]|uniref:Integral membrane protein n=1 Tax=Streptomyces gilvifuscus TaxID=1550617 RepID=A0ABT5FQH1_9ACTN|nr:hypothetical protein [Streptomyces gilvifuscus]MDC2954794.1 hypothetical protein [Streptomyces gilvifuscus]
MAHASSRRGPGPLAPGSPKARRDVRRAWLWLLMLLPAMVLAVLVGDWLLRLQGHDDGYDTVPLGATLLAGGVALLVLIAPGIAALLFGLRARRHGAAAGLAPALAGGIAAVGLVVLNVVSLIVSR